MNELQIPTRSIDVEVFTRDGMPIRGEFFLGSLPDREPSAAGVVALLNDERTFVPFRCADGGRTLLNKAHITRVRIQGATEEELRGEVPLDIDAPLCTLHMTDGTRIDGKAVVDTPASSSRLFDKLNRASRFTPFVSDDGIEIVSVVHVVRAD